MPPKKLLGSGVSGTPWTPTPCTPFCLICTISSELKCIFIFNHLTEPWLMSAGSQWRGSTPAGFQEAFRAATISLKGHEQNVTLFDKPNHATFSVRIILTHTHESVMLHTWISHVTRVRESCHTHTLSLFRLWDCHGHLSSVFASIHVFNSICNLLQTLQQDPKKIINGPCHAYIQSCMRTYIRTYTHAHTHTHKHIWIAYVLILLIRVIWLIHTCEVTHSYVWNDSFMHVTWLIHVCDMTHAYFELGSANQRCHDVKHSHHMTWLIHTSDMTHSYVWKDSFILGSANERFNYIDMTHWHDMTHPYVRQNSIIPQTW